MPERLISGDNHIDLTYCPPDLWSSRAPSKWLADRVRRKITSENVIKLYDLR